MRFRRRFVPPEKGPREPGLMLAGGPLAVRLRFDHLQFSFVRKSLASDMTLPVDADRPKQQLSVTSERGSEGPLSAASI